MSFPYLTDLVNYIFSTDIHLPLATFGAFVALAIIVATFIAKSEVRRYEGLGLLAVGFKSSGARVKVHELVGDLSFISVVWGLVGARIFHILEYPSDFLNNPLAMIFSSSGMSIYGGLLVGVAAGVIYLKKHKVPLLPVFDAVAPALAIGYCLGRLGCQLSGDGDWGEVSDLTLKPDFVPTWLWAQTYENNVVGELIAEPGVYPTPIYESVASFFIFAVLWKLRQFKFATGFIFSLYLIFSGFARLLVEKIRVNSEYQVFGFLFTQAEIISFVLILLGLIGVVRVTQKPFRFKLIFSIFVVTALSACTQF